MIRSPTTFSGRCVFEAQVGETSLLNETPDGDFYVFRVDQIDTTGSSVRLDEVRAEVLGLWRREEARQHALIQAEALADQLRLGGRPGRQWRVPKALSLGSTGADRPLRRGPARHGASPDLTAKLFGLVAEGEFAVAEVTDGWVDPDSWPRFNPATLPPTLRPSTILPKGLAESAAGTTPWRPSPKNSIADLGVSINQGAIDDILATY